MNGPREIECSLHKFTSSAIIEIFLKNINCFETLAEGSWAHYKCAAKLLNLWVCRTKTGDRFTKCRNCRTGVSVSLWWRNGLKVNSWQNFVSFTNQDSLYFLFGPSQCICR